ncbi:MAG: hypothetical protein KF893_14895 [Caldilineaceae bacterium]|nr:hypothetical protein [Caldilineaceae bacterium]
MTSDPSYIQLVRIVHQERIDAAIKRNRYGGSIVDMPSLTARLLSTIGALLILVGQRLKAS